MGCGSSSLKGEKVEDGTSAAAPERAKRVQTNFSAIDFSTGAAADRRGTMAVAPDETRRPTRVSEMTTDGGPDSPAKSKASIEKQNQSGAKLEPYRSIDGDDEALQNSSLPPKKVDVNPDMHPGEHPANPEAASLATAGTSNANPIKA